MGNYSIKELEKLSGIKAHTIRIWEKRYGVVQPSRTNTNIRYYTDADLRKIINVALLNNHGVKISKIAGLSVEELNRRVQELTDEQPEASAHIDQLVVSMISLEEEQFDKALSHLVLRYGIEYTMTEVVYPFLHKIGVLWQTGNITPAQEHFVSNLIRQKIIVAIDALPLANKGAKSAVLFLPEFELHEIGLLFHYYIVKKAGLKTYYLGQMVPLSDVHKICEDHNPNFLITSITTAPAPKDVQDLLTNLCAKQPGRQVLVTGPVVQKMALRLPSNLHMFHSSQELRLLLANLNVSLNKIG